MLGSSIKGNWMWSSKRQQDSVLGISELKWMGMSKFNLDDHYIYYCGQESLRRNGVALTVNKSPKCSNWVQSKNDRMISVLSPKQTIQYHGNPTQIHVP